MTNKSANDKALVKCHSDIKEQESVKAKDLSANLNEAVEKSLVKSSSDEAQSSPR
jgi:hypothetical protein